MSVPLPCSVPGIDWLPFLLLACRFWRVQTEPGAPPPVDAAAVPEYGAAEGLASGSWWESMNLTVFGKQVTNEQAKMMQTLMPVIFTVMMLFLPAGLTVYIFASTVIGVIQTLIFVRPNSNDRVPLAPHVSSGQ